MSNEKNIKEVIEPVYDNSNNIILKKLYENDKNSDIYWSIKNIADYIGQSERTVRRNLLTNPKFPQPIILGRNNAKRIWLAKDVKLALLAFNNSNNE